ncbi:receptor kinase-like protein Xa21 [Typha angustifolia]|uniref:receptor kinase-like protein Xa21 n=1 Tax=Typha angustifolia TaxID=59011 RepID=UPI003C2B6E09
MELSLPPWCGVGRASSRVPSPLNLLYVILFLSLITTTTPLMFALNGTTTSASDGRALLYFKSLLSDPSKALASWDAKKSPDFCQWRGVTCGKRGRRRHRVTALVLDSLHLAGSISPSIANITFLNSLDLSSNQLHGLIPQQLGSLSHLKNFNLSFNSLEGEIPASISNCTSLQSISLNSNNLRGRIPSNLSLCSDLRYIDFENNNLTGGIPSEIGDLVNLELLLMGVNMLEGPIPDSIGKLQKLSALELSKNGISGSIPSTLGNLSSLILLLVENTSLTGSIPSTMSMLSSLAILSLAGNHLQGGIPPSLGNLSSLDTLNVGENDLTGSIPSSLGSLSFLTTLELFENNLVGGIPPSLGNLLEITAIDMGFNNLTGRIPPLFFLNMTSLGLLDLQNNTLVGSLPLDIGPLLPSLQYLYLNNNLFYGSIPSSLSNSSMLGAIQLDYNSFTGTIPASVGTLKSLYWLTVNNNQLEAKDWSFLTALANCTYLRVLQLGTNNLNGVLPNAIANLSTSLEYFDVSFNQLEGSIPVGIGNLVNLSILTCNNNFLTGAIPATLARLEMLHIIYLDGNNLSGEIPSTFGNLTQLTQLELSFNALSGNIPSSLGRCPLELLGLNNNSFTGGVPKDVFLIPTLSIYLRLSHNLLSGPLPDEVGSLSNLRELNLQGNRFGGQIPSLLGECQILEYLYLDRNLFQGPIPSSLSQLRGLQVLDLSHNNLSGPIPEFLATFSELSSLNLSSNNFEGEVPLQGVFNNASAISIDGNSMLCGGISELKLPQCPVKTSKKKKKKHPSPKLIVIISVSAALLSCIILLSFTAAAQYWRRKSRKEPSNMTHSSEPYMWISYADLVRATQGFSPANLIGVGSFGSVYKGNIDSAEEHNLVAVKVLNLQQRGALRSFTAECEALRCIRHRNLVKILTACSSVDFRGNDFKALVFEYFPNGSLDQWLHPQVEEQSRVLSFIQRLNIAIDVASALDYLHHHGPIPIVHCDLKPSNVLLDDDMVAHVGDFGLARILKPSASVSSQKSTNSAALKGSIGYVAPEYGMANKVSTHGDIYSYGILLLEMFTGKRPTDDYFKESLSLFTYVEMTLLNQMIDIIDPNLFLEETVGESSREELRRVDIREGRIDCIISVLTVGLLCSKELPTERMQTRDIIKELTKIKQSFCEMGVNAVDRHHAKIL